MTPASHLFPKQMFPKQHFPDSNRGFTLVEMAVVLVIVGVMLGGLLIPATTQLENNRRAEAETRLNEMHAALIGFATRTGRLPCPATTASNGLAAPNTATTACTTQHGFVPIRTLALNLPVDDNDLPADPWLNAYRYSITNSDGGAFTNAITLGLTPDFETCADAACATVLADNVVAVIFSTGEDGATATSLTQVENLDADTRFVSRTYSEATGNEFDDEVLWISPNTLTYYLVRAGQIN